MSSSVSTDDEQLSLRSYIIHATRLTAISRNVPQTTTGTMDPISITMTQSVVHYEGGGGQKGLKCFAHRGQRQQSKCVWPIHV